MNTERIKKFVGGQAVIEGVMMRGPGYTATAVREPAGTIVVQKEATKSIADTYPILKKPFLRGCVALYESLVIGMKALSFSARQLVMKRRKCLIVKLPLPWLFPQSLR